MLNAALLELANRPPPDDLDIRPGTIREVLRQYRQQWPFRDEQTMRTIMAYLVSNTKDVYGRIADRFPRDMYLDSLLVKERHISAVNAAKLVGDYTLLKQLTATGMFYEQIVIERRQRPLKEIDLSGLPFTLSSYLYSRAASPTAPVELKQSERKDYATRYPSGWMPQKDAKRMLIALGVDAELVKGLSRSRRTSIRGARRRASARSEAATIARSDRSSKSRWPTLPSSTRRFTRAGRTVQSAERSGRSSLGS